MLDKVALAWVYARVREVLEKSLLTLSFTAFCLAVGTFHFDSDWKNIREILYLGLQLKHVETFQVL
jgi:hypothetical protein